MDVSVANVRTQLTGSNVSNDRRRVRVIVVDPITNLFKDILINTSAQGERLLNSDLHSVRDPLFKLLFLLLRAWQAPGPCLPTTVYCMIDETYCRSRCDDQYYGKYRRTYLHLRLTYDR